MTQGRSASVRGIAVGSNGGFVFTGFSKNPLDRSFDSWLGHINAEGDILWQQFLDIEGPDYLHAIDRNENKEYIAAGARKVPGSEKYQALLIRFPESGRQPEVSFHAEEGSYKARDILITGSGDYVLAGSAKPEGGDREQMWFYKNPKKVFMSNP